LSERTLGIVDDARARWPEWCCSYCATPLRPEPHGLFCEAEGRFFATQNDVHRLLPEERRRELLPGIEMYQRVRRDEGAGVPGSNAASLRFAIETAGRVLGPGPWRALEMGAGSCRVSIELLARGHDVVATDINMDPEDGLPAAGRRLPHGTRLPRAEAEMEAQPFAPGVFDLVVVAAALHYSPRVARALIEARRVTRRGGALLVWDSPLYRKREDGEAMIAARMQRHSRRYGLVLPRENEAGYLVLGELRGLFAQAGWSLTVLGWPDRLREIGGDLLSRGRQGSRAPRFPLLVAQRD
jgi:SAM-dependent methyltransferase